MSKLSLTALSAVLAFAAIISAANAQAPPTQEFTGLPPDPKPVGLPPDPKWIVSPANPLSIKPPAASEAAGPPSTSKPVAQPHTPGDRPGDTLAPTRAVEIPLPSSFPAEAIWGSTGRDTSGHIWLGVSTRGYGPSAHLLEYAPDTGKFRDRGDVISELKRAGVWREGEAQAKIHTKIFQAADGYLYFASFDEEGESVPLAIKPKWGGHIWRLKPNSDHWEHLRAVPEGMIALAGYGNWIYALGYWDQVLYQYDTTKRTWRSITVGSVRGHVSRNIVVDLHGHVYVPRAREWRPAEAAAHPNELFSAELVEFDTNLKEVSSTRLDNYIDPHDGRNSHGIIGLTYLANGPIVISTHRGYLYRVTPANSGAAKIEGLGWVYPNGPSYAASLFPMDGTHLAAVTAVEGAPAQLVIYDLRTQRGRAQSLRLEAQDLLLYGTSTCDNNGRCYVVGWQKNFPHGHKPIMLQIDIRK
ncbi:MAG TPA: hypothetical protein VLL04_11400 [Rhizomicrobium sp.]|nr:hypothetical protein [Rhizomicrobium sp.]